MNINLTAPINSLGYGVVSLNILKALSAKHEPALWALGNVECPPSDQKIVDAALKRTTAFDYNRAASLRIWHAHDMAHHVGSGGKFGFPIFELNRFTKQEKHHLSSLDGLIVASDWAATVAEENGFEAYVVPFAVDTSVFKPSPRETTETTVFLNVGKWEIRKGHDILIKAFDMAFEPGDKVELNMLCSNPFIRNDGNNRWRDYYLNSKMGRAGKVHVIPRLPSQQHVASLMNDADCGVFPARAEGWNLELAEMMAMGKQVIATNCTAHTEFCNPGNARLIDVPKLESAVDGVFFREHVGYWHEIDMPAIQQIAEHMRKVYRLKQAEELCLNQAGIDTFTNEFTWENTADGLVEVLASA